MKLLVTVIIAFFATATLAQDGATGENVSTPLSFDVLIEKHAQAIALGRQEFEVNMRLDPVLVGLDDADYRGYANELMDGFLDGSDIQTLEDFVHYAPAFTGYVQAFAEDFEYSGVLSTHVSIAEQNVLQAEGEARIAEGEGRIAEGEARIAELKRINAALRELQAVLRAHSGD